MPTAAESGDDARTWNRGVSRDLQLSTYCTVPLLSRLEEESKCEMAATAEGLAKAVALLDSDEEAQRLQGLRSAAAGKAASPACEQRRRSEMSDRDDCRRPACG